jgi:hypothetical protein
VSPPPPPPPPPPPSPFPPPPPSPSPLPPPSPPPPIPKPPPLPPFPPMPPPSPIPPPTPPSPPRPPPGCNCEIIGTNGSCIFISTCPVRLPAVYYQPESGGSRSVSFSAVCIGGGGGGGGCGNGGGGGGGALVWSSDLGITCTGGPCPDHWTMMVNVGAAGTNTPGPAGDCTPSSGGASFISGAGPFHAEGGQASRNPEGGNGGSPSL